MTAIVCITRAELAAFLLYRVLKRGKDDRFDVIRGNCCSFLVFWIFQMVWAWGVMLPVMYTNADPATADPPLGVRDGVGIAMWAIGFIVQVIADLQKDKFRANAANRSRTCDTGVWSWSRHPNFFGEIFLWWGVFVLCSPQFDASTTAAGAGAAGAGTWGYATVISPILTMIILLLGSGMPTAEGDNQRRFMKDPVSKMAFLAYRDRTSPVVPLPPFIYSALPLWFKRWFLFEWKMYETDWAWTPESSAANNSASGDKTSSNGSGKGAASSSPSKALGVTAPATAGGAEAAVEGYQALAAVQNSA